MLGVVAMEVVWFIAGGALGTLVGAFIGYAAGLMGIVIDYGDGDDAEY